MDKSTTIEQIKQQAIKFRDARNWKQFHDPKNLSAALSIESSELQEIFLWKTKNDIEQLLDTDEGRKRVEEEMADILVFLLFLADACRVDLSEIVERKIEINKGKYPIEKSYGSSKKYSELEDCR